MKSTRYWTARAPAAATLKPKFRSNIRADVQPAGKKIKNESATTINAPAALADCPAAARALGGGEQILQVPDSVHRQRNRRIREQHQEHSSPSGTGRKSPARRFRAPEMQGKGRWARRFPRAPARTVTPATCESPPGDGRRSENRTGTSAARETPENRASARYPFEIPRRPAGKSRCLLTRSRGASKASRSKAW